MKLLPYIILIVLFSCNNDNNQVPKVENMPVVKEEKKEFLRSYNMLTLFESPKDSNTIEIYVDRKYDKLEVFRFVRINWYKFNGIKGQYYVYNQSKNKNNLYFQNDSLKSFVMNYFVFEIGEQDWKKLEFQLDSFAHKYIPDTSASMGPHSNFSISGVCKGLHFQNDDANKEQLLKMYENLLTHYINPIKKYQQLN